MSPDMAQLPPDLVDVAMMLLPETLAHNPHDLGASLSVVEDDVRFYTDTAALLQPVYACHGEGTPRPRPPTPEDDMFALGCIVAELYNGEPLFSHATLAQHCASQPGSGQLSACHDVHTALCKLPDSWQVCVCARATGTRAVPHSPHAPYRFWSADRGCSPSAPASKCSAFCRHHPCQSGLAAAVLPSRPLSAVSVGRGCQKAVTSCAGLTFACASCRQVLPSHHPARTGRRRAPEPANVVVGGASGPCLATLARR